MIKVLVKLSTTVELELDENLPPHSQRGSQEEHEAFAETVWENVIDYFQQGGDGCTVEVVGGDADAYRAAVEREMRDRTGLEPCDYMDVFERSWLGDETDREEPRNPEDFARAFCDWWIEKYDLDDLTVMRKAGII